MTKTDKVGCPKIQSFYAEKDATRWEDNPQDGEGT